MQAVTVAFFGGPEALELGEHPAPILTRGQLLISVEAAAVGLVDVRMRSGLYPSVSEPGFVPGGEIAGVVIAANDPGDADWVGKRVYALSRRGGYAEQCAVDVAIVEAIPDGLASVDAVALGANALVAEFCLRKGGIEEGDRLLVRGASGGIGLATVQSALRRRAHVTAITSSPAWITLLQGMGADAVYREDIDALAEDFDAVIDPVGGEDVERHVGHLRAGGRYVVCGAAAGRPDPAFGMSLFKWAPRSLSLAFQSLDSVPLPELNAAASAIFNAALRGELKSLIDTVYPLKDAQLAHRRLEEGSVFGRLVLTP